MTTERELQDTEHTPLPWWNESRVVHATVAAARAGGAIHPAVCERNADADFIEHVASNHDPLLAALDKCKRLAIERVGTADAAVKKDIYAADALMAIAEIARNAIEDANA